MSIYSDDSGWTHDEYCLPVDLSASYQKLGDAGWTTGNAGSIVSSYEVELPTSFPYDRFGYEIGISTSDTADAGLYNIKTNVQSSAN